MLVKPAGKQVDFNKMDKAQEHNDDGYGVAWYEDKMVKTYKTFNYNQFKGVVAALKHHQLVVHLRYATRGDKSYNNIHPFDIPSGVLFHNGTMFGLGDTNVSDSKELADTISLCDYKFIEDIEPLIKPYIDDKINRLVFFEDNGRVTIMNEKLGLHEDGIWYSNDYHIKDEGWCRAGCKSKTEEKKTKMTLLTEKKYKVFVYGTLKKGYSNHRLLENAVALGKATTLQKWTMIGNNMPFPYVLEQDILNGKNIVGEVYLVDNKELAHLNILEGVPYHYVPKQISVRYKDDASLDKVTMYVKTSIPKGYIEANTMLTEWTAGT